MKHSSVAIAAPEFINITPINPLVSKCEIKVCYVGDNPNRNKTIITKDVAQELANSLPSSPIVGHYNRDMGDFEEHNKVVEISSKGFNVKEDTFPFGFVPPNARVWFQKFVDDGAVEREYLVTEGILWTGQYPEAQRIIDKGNNQSMELDEESVKGTWTKNGNGKVEFFIINEAIISKLCVLGEDFEPCFEGSQIKRLEFSLGNEFKTTMFSMIEEFKQIMEEGGIQQMPEDILEVGAQVEPVIDTPVVDTPIVEEPVVEETVIETVEASAEGEFAKKDEKTQDETSKEDTDETDVNKEDGTSDEEDKKKKYSLEEVTEYTELLGEFTALQTSFAALEEELAGMKTEFSRLQEFENTAIGAKKDELINSFYMLSDEDKKDVIEKKNTYSLEDIEAKLSVICVRNKVNFSLDSEEKSTEQVITYGLDDQVDDSVPAWIKAVERVQKNQ